LNGNFVTVFRTDGDMFFYVTGGAEENELILFEVLNTFCDTLLKHISSSTKPQSFDLKTLLDHFDWLELMIDEMIDGGILLETDPEMLEIKTYYQNIPLADQTISQVVQSAGEQFFKR